MIRIHLAKQYVFPDMFVQAAGVFGKTSQFFWSHTFQDLWSAPTPPIALPCTPPISQLPSIASAA